MCPNSMTVQIVCRPNSPYIKSYSADNVSANVNVLTCAGADSGLGAASSSLGGGQHLGQGLGRAGAPQDTQGGQHRQVQAAILI